MDLLSVFGGLLHRNEWSSISGILTLIPDTCYQDPDLKFIPLENMPLYHWHLIWKKKASSLLQKKFIEILKSEY